MKSVLIDHEPSWNHLRVKNHEFSSPYMPTHDAAILWAIRNNLRKSVGSRYTQARLPGSTDGPLFHIITLQFAEPKVKLGHNSALTWQDVEAVYPEAAAQWDAFGSRDLLAFTLYWVKWWEGDAPGILLLCAPGCYNTTMHDVEDCRCWLYNRIDVGPMQWIDRRTLTTSEPVRREDLALPDWWCRAPYTLGPLHHAEDLPSCAPTALAHGEQEKAP